MALTPEEGAILGQLADNLRSATRFTPGQRSRRGYRAFNADVVWPLEQLQRRGFVKITERAAAGVEGGDTCWDGVAAELTPAGREAAAGHPRNSVGLPGVPEG